MPSPQKPRVAEPAGEEKLSRLLADAKESLGRASKGWRGAAERAENRAQEALELATELGDEAGKMEAYGLLARGALKRNSLEKALGYLRKLPSSKVNEAVEEQVEELERAVAGGHNGSTIRQVDLILKMAELTPDSETAELLKRSLELTEKTKLASYSARLKKRLSPSKKEERLAEAEAPVAQADWVSGTLTGADKSDDSEDFMELGTFTPDDIVVTYQSASKSLVIDFIERKLNEDEKKFTAIDNGGIYISTIQKIGQLSIPVLQREGSLRVSGNGTLLTYGYGDRVSVPARNLVLSGTLEKGVELQTAGQGKGRTWDLHLKGRLYDPDERAPKVFPVVEIGDKVVKVEGHWDTDGTRRVSLGISEGRRGTQHNLSDYKEVERLTEALQDRAPYSHESIRLSEEAGAYTLTMTNSMSRVKYQVVLNAEASRKTAKALREAARHVAFP